MVAAVTRIPQLLDCALSLSTLSLYSVYCCISLLLVCLLFLLVVVDRSIWSQCGFPAAVSARTIEFSPGYRKAQCEFRLVGCLLRVRLSVFCALVFCILELGSLLVF